MKQLLMLAIMALFLILVAGWGQQASAQDQVIVDHFKCYKVKGKAINETHTVRDQFEEESDTIGKPALICNPVQKTFNGETARIAHPNSHLACYKAKGKNKLPAVTVQVQNQFGAQVLKVAKKEKLLCVPSFKHCLDDDGKRTFCPNEQRP